MSDFGVLEWHGADMNVDVGRATTRRAGEPCMSRAERVFQRLPRGTRVGVRARLHNGLQPRVVASQRGFSPPKKPDEPFPRASKNGCGGSNEGIGESLTRPAQFPTMEVPANSPCGLNRSRCSYLRACRGGACTHSLACLPASQVLAQGSPMAL